MLKIPLPRGGWDVRTPVVVRYLPKEHVEQFFATGRLRLSSFNRFAQHADEERLDQTEGTNILTGIGDRHLFVAVTRQGRQSLVLCGSTREEEQLMSDFRCNGYFRIVNTTAFAMAIGRRLDGLVAGTEGHCIYTDHRVIRRRISFDARELQITPDRPELSMDKMREVLGRVGGIPDVFLLKHRRFRHQCEYRMLWHIDRDVPDFQDIECPEARMFCERP